MVLGLYVSKYQLEKIFLLIHHIHHFQNISWTLFKREQRFSEPNQKPNWSGNQGKLRPIYASICNVERVAK